VEIKVESIAELCHQVNKAYCESIGDFSQPDFDDAPQWQRESALNGVTAHISGQGMTPEQSHESWMKEKVDNGWVYGEVKDPIAKTHPCIVPYNELSLEQRTKDYLFKAICDFYKKNFIGGIV
jgi:hypothetical protein